MKTILLIALLIGAFTTANADDTKGNVQIIEVGAELIKDTVIRGGQAHPGIAFIKLFMSPTVVGNSEAVPGSKPNAMGPNPAPRRSTINYAESK